MVRRSRWRRQFAVKMQGGYRQRGPCHLPGIARAGGAGPFAQCHAGSCGHSPASCAGLMLPPLQMIATFRPANRPGALSTAARAAAPAGSTRLRVFSIISRVAAFSASSETRTKSSSRSR